jgi:dihydroorotate dehydrogenase (fumarate)
MLDLTTTYLGLKLKHPFVASASPLSKQMDTIRELEQAGVAAIVLYSLFEEQIIQDSLKLHSDLERGAWSIAEAQPFIPDFGMYKIGPQSYLEHLHRVKSAVSVPVIGSLNGISTGGWVEYARKIQDAGADALELNLYDLAADFSITSAELEDRHIQLVMDIRKGLKIPLAVKLSPFYTALPNFTRKLAEAGAQGLVLFNRFYQPDFDLEALEVTPNLVLSNSHELRLPLRWIAILYGKLGLDFALTSGIHTAEDAIKAVMAGASVTMMASELLRNGIGRIPELLADLQRWMEEHEYMSIGQMKGSMSQQAVAEPERFERANYLKVLSSY